MNKVYEVSYDTGYDYSEVIARFSTLEKAESFVEACKKRFYVGIVGHDYRGYELTITDFDLDEFDNITFETK